MTFLPGCISVGLPDFGFFVNHASCLDLSEPCRRSCPADASSPVGLLHRGPARPRQPRIRGQLRRAGVARRSDLDVSGIPRGARAPRKLHDDHGPPRGLHVGVAPHRGGLGRVRSVRRGDALLAAGVHDRRIEHHRPERPTLRHRVRPAPPTLLLPVGGGERVAVADGPGNAPVSSARAHGGHDLRGSVRCVSRGAGERAGHPPLPRVDVGGRERQGPRLLLGRCRPGREVRDVRLAGGEARPGRDHVAPGQAALLTGVPCAGGPRRLRRRGRSHGPKAEASCISTARNSSIRDSVCFAVQSPRSRSLPQPSSNPQSLASREGTDPSESATRRAGGL